MISKLLMILGSMYLVSSHQSYDLDDEHYVFKYLKPEEIRKRLGLKADYNQQPHSQIQTDRLGMQPHVDAVVALPSIFSSYQQYPNCKSAQVIQNQQQCGSCSTFSSSTLLSERYCVDSNGTIDLQMSAQNTLDCAIVDCQNGAQLSNIMSYLTNPGIMSSNCYGSYTASKNSCKKNCSNGASGILYSCKPNTVVQYSVSNPQSIMQAIYQGGVVLDFSVYYNFYSYMSGTYNQPSGMYEGGHSIYCFGYDQPNNLYMCQNQWGSSWGSNGKFNISMSSSVLQDSWACQSNFNNTSPIPVPINPTNLTCQQQVMICLQTQSPAICNSQYFNCLYK